MSDKIILKSNLDGISDAYIEFTGSGIRIGSNGVGVWLAADQARHLYAELGDNGLGGWTYNSQPAEPVPPVALHTAEYEELRKIIHAVELAATSGLAEVYNVIRQKEQGAVNGMDWIRRDLEGRIDGAVRAENDRATEDLKRVADLIEKQIISFRDVLDRESNSLQEQIHRIRSQHALQEDLEALRAGVNGADSVVQRHVAALENRVTALEQQPGPVNTIEPDDTFHRQHLYNQAYLAALPALVRVGQIPDDIAHMADLIATMCMEHLK